MPVEGVRVPWFQECMDARADRDKARAALGESQKELDSVQTDLSLLCSLADELVNEVEDLLVYGDNRDEVVQKLRETRQWLKDGR